MKNTSQNLSTAGRPTHANAIPINELPVERIVVGDRSCVLLRVVTAACQRGFNVHPEPVLGPGVKGGLG